MSLFTEVCLKLRQKPSRVEASNLNFVIKQLDCRVALVALATATVALSHDHRISVQDDHEHDVGEG